MGVALYAFSKLAMLDMDLLATPRQHNKVRTAFKTLISLHIYIVTPSLFDPDKTHHDDGELGVISFEEVENTLGWDDALFDFLQSAPNLRKVQLNLSNETDQDYGKSEVQMLDLGSIVRRFTWQHLRIISLHGFSARQGDLTDSLTRRQVTLERLALTAVDLSEGDWCNYFTAIAGKLPKLNIIRLRDEFTCDRYSYFRRI